MSASIFEAVEDSQAPAFPEEAGKGVFTIAHLHVRAVHWPIFGGSPGHAESTSGCFSTKCLAWMSTCT